MRIHPAIDANTMETPNTKIASSDIGVRNAVERFLGTSPEQITTAAQQTLEGVLREVVSQLTPEEVNEDRLKFAETLVENARDDLDKLGLELDVRHVDEPRRDQRFEHGRVSHAALGLLQVGDRLVRELPAAEPALQYAASLVRATRPDADRAPAMVQRYVRWGAGPRAGQALILGAKAHALLDGRSTVAPEDIRRVALPVLRHRVLLSFAAEAEGMRVERILEELVAQVAPPRSGIPH